MAALLGDPQLAAEAGEAGAAAAALVDGGSDAATADALAELLAVPLGDLDAMRIMLDLTDEGDIIDENGERQPLFPYDPESLGNDILE